MARHRLRRRRGHDRLRQAERPADRTRQGRGARRLPRGARSGAVPRPAADQSGAPARQGYLRPHHSRLFEQAGDLRASAGQFETAARSRKDLRRPCLGRRRGRGGAHRSAACDRLGEQAAPACRFRARPAGADALARARPRARRNTRRWSWCLAHRPHAPVAGASCASIAHPIRRRHLLCRSARAPPPIGCSPHARRNCVSPIPTTAVSSRSSARRRSKLRHNLSPKSPSEGHATRLAFALGVQQE